MHFYAELISDSGVGHFVLQRQQIFSDGAALGQSAKVHLHVPWENAPADVSAITSGTVGLCVCENPRRAGFHEPGVDASSYTAILFRGSPPVAAVQTDSDPF